VPKILLFHEVTADGGVHTSIDRGHERLFYRSQGRSGERDDTLLWSVQLWFQGSDLPEDQNETRQWLLTHEDIIRSCLLACSNGVEAGRDPENISRVTDHFFWHPFLEPLPDVDLRIYAHISRSLTQPPMASILEEMATSWSSRIESLEADDPLT
jgi:hypothetical protein